MDMIAASMRGLYGHDRILLHRPAQTDKGIPVASQTSAIENIKEGRCAIAEHVILRFPLTTPLICKALFSAVGVTAFGSPSCFTTFHSLLVLRTKRQEGSSSNDRRLL